MKRSGAPGGKGVCKKDSSNDPVIEYNSINGDGTLGLVHKALAAGVRGFVFGRSVKVNGDQVVEGQSCNPDDGLVPQDHCGMSQMEAEHGLRQLAVENGMEGVSIRLFFWGPPRESQIYCANVNRAPRLAPALWSFAVQA